jgi:hypothetical protein
MLFGTFLILRHTYFTQFITENLLIFVFLGYILGA